MSEVVPQAVPEMLLYDWCVIGAGLLVGMGIVFQIIEFSMVNEKKMKKTLYTWTNFWLILSGVIHCWIEYNFTFHRTSSFIKTALDLYAAADYRYGVYAGGMMESGTAAMEAITAILDGPMCFLVVFASVHGYSWHHPLRIILCTCQLYGLVWFVLQPIFSVHGIAGHFASDPILFWLVAVGCNAPWGIFPTILLVQSFRECCISFSKTTKND